MGLRLILVWILLFAGNARGTEADGCSFAVVGHLRGNANGELYFLLDEVVDRIRTLEPDMVFLTGDLIWGDYHSKQVDGDLVRSDWEKLDRALAPLGVPIHRVPGNHDINDPVTEKIWNERYGELPRSFAYCGHRFILLNSTRVDPVISVPRGFIRPRSLPQAQIDFLRGELTGGAPTSHTFVFLHHVLWWNEGASWWQEVHPVLQAGDVHAVFAGDYGPLKFSHWRRDDIDYLQSAIEGRVSLPILRAREMSRLLHYQLDNFLLVRTSVESVSIDVEVVGALSSKKFRPPLFHQVYAPAETGLRARIETALGGPLRRLILAGLCFACFAVGFCLALFVRRSSR